MYLFDANDCLRKCKTPEQICREFFDIRKQKYIERKDVLEGLLKAQCERLSEQARFILMTIKNEICLENKQTSIIEQLIQKNFKPDPVKRWKAEQKKRKFAMNGEVVFDEDEEAETQEITTDKRSGNYDYLLGMTIWKLSMEEKDKMLAESEEKMKELKVLQAKKWNDLWEEELVVFVDALDKQEKKENEEENQIKFSPQCCPNKTAVRVEFDRASLMERYSKKTTKKGKIEDEETPQNMDENPDDLFSDELNDFIFESDSDDKENETNVVEAIVDENPKNKAVKAVVREQVNFELLNRTL